MLLSRFFFITHRLTKMQHTVRAFIKCAIDLAGITSRMLYDQRSRAELSFICENTLMPVMVLSCQWYRFKTLISSSNLDMRKLYENISRQILFIELSQAVKSEIVCNSLWAVAINKVLVT